MKYDTKDSNSLTMIVILEVLWDLLGNKRVKVRRRLLKDNVIKLQASLHPVESGEIIKNSCLQLYPSTTLEQLTDS